ncbi:hypothetical protein GCM10012320_08340 [Sinomonas cellulolyticus]|uniref:VWFA domain-containing protein n=1 Tax=Sinomonas cellulolyticus TaxID=2801916 RepID=A0ABS1K3N4_9MICC|nr:MULTISPECIES: hypothetical protein [Sinomonas]MBL0706296.1 hypothetical protein [Sinomonas cellulolyticus]GHG43909.1 hypothetical protein GCM10012320_08340 [Sinomonas sp. KCTC 49339]
MKTAACLASALRGDSTPMHAEAGVETRLGFPGLCPEHSVLTAFLIDDSGSVIGPAGNDPLSNRYAEIRRAITAIRRWCLCGNEHVSIIHFDTPTSGCLAPRTLRRTSTSVLARSLRTPPDAAGQSVALGALSALATHHTAVPDSELVTVILTDWELFDDPKELEGALAGLPGQIVSVGLGIVKRPAVLPPGAQFIPVTPQSTPGTVAQAVFDALKVHRMPLISNPWE